MKIPDTGKIIQLAQIAGLLIAVYMIYKILSGVGLIKTTAKKKEEDKKEQAAEDLRALTYFDSMFLKGKTGYNSLGSSVAEKYAEDLKKAIRGFGTNEEAIYSVFEKLTKWNISEVTLNYYKLYNSDLLADLLNELTAAEKVTLFEIIDKQPTK